jgi:hypothetical protein
LLTPVNIPSEVIALAQESTERMPPTHKLLATGLHTLSKLLLERYIHGRARNVADTDKEIHVAERATQLTANLNSGAASILTALGQAVLSRDEFRGSGQIRPEAFDHFK